MIEELRRIRDLFRSYQRAGESKLYRIEGGPEDNRFILIYPDGDCLLCANAGTHPVEPLPMRWSNAKMLADQRRW